MQLGKKGKYTVEFGSGGGTGIMKKLTSEIGKNVTLTKHAFARSGYTFKGWKLYNKTTKKYLCYSNKQDKNWVSSTNYCNSYGYVIYKEGAKIGGSAPAGTKYKVIAYWEKKPTSSGSSGSNLPSGNNNSQTMTITLDAGKHGTLSDNKLTLSVNGVYSNLPIPKSKKGWNFVGWYTSSNYQVLPEDNVSQSVKTLYAHYQKRK